MNLLGTSRFMALWSDTPTDLAVPMIVPPINVRTEQLSFRWDARDTSFLLWELFKVDTVFLGRPPCSAVTRADVERLFRQAIPHVQRLAAANASGRP